MQAAHNADPAKWEAARSFGMVYPGSVETESVLREAHALFFGENGRHFAAFPSIARFESEIVALTADLFHAPAPIGHVLSGGTECALVVMKTLRDQARAERGVDVPEVILPTTAYPVYALAAHYLGVRAVPIGIDTTYKADLRALAAAITPNTIMMVGSAPGWPYGIIDPIGEMGEIAQATRVHLHVDACVGGYQIPFIRRLGNPAENFDFSLPGVGSIAADLHKFGYSAQGSATLLYRDAATHRYQRFTHPDWPMGQWSNDAFLTTRPAASIAAAWAVMNFLGEDGYLQLTKKVLKATQHVLSDIATITGLHVLGTPRTSVFAFGSDNTDLDINSVAGSLRDKGWFIRQRANDCIHVVLTPPHAQVADVFLADLRQAATS